MVRSPENSELNGNPIKLFSSEEIDDYYAKNTFDFNECALTKMDNFCPEHWDNEFGALAWRLRSIVVRKACERNSREEWDEHTNLIHDYFRNPHILQNYYICKNKAYLKLCEILKVLNSDVFRTDQFRSFHLCEGPGYFVEATYTTWLRQKGSGTGSWQWAANTLNPYFENNSPLYKLVDDSHIRGHMANWVFGPSDDGDVGKLSEDYLTRNGLAGTFDLVTADGSTNTVGFEDQVEDKVNRIVTAEIQAALILLRAEGRFILKIYRFSNSRTREAVTLLANHFSSIKAFKPMSSRPGSQEKYLICDGYGGSCKIDVQMMLNCDKMFLEKQLERIRFHLDTFHNVSKRNYTQDHKKQFVMAMRPKLFTAESAQCVKELRKLFPTGHTRQPSPWAQFYPHNLIKRFDGPNMPNEISNYLNTANIFDPDKNPLDINSVVQLIMQQQEVLFITSDIELYIQDTLFMDSCAYYAVLHYEPRNIYYDFFEQVSTLNSVPDTTWRKHLNTDTLDVVLTVDFNITIEHILIAIDEGVENNMTSFTICKLTTDVAPLYVSRLSASMFVLFYLMFENCEYTEGRVKWSGQKFVHYDSVRPLIKRLRNEICTLPKCSSVRSFLPLRILDAFHAHVCYRNVIHMMAARRIIEEKKLE